MKVHKKIISVILIIGLIFGGVSVNPVEAKKVEMKTKNGNPELKISLLNEELDYRLKEVAFKIKNKSDKKIKVTKVNVQFKSNGEWTTLKKQKKSVAKRKMVITEEDVAYDSVNLYEDYVIPENGLIGGKYSIYIKYKYKGKHYYKRKVFTIEGKEPVIETPPEVTKDESSIKADSVAVSDNASQVKARIINTDFSIAKNGRATAMVFSEANYKTTKKAKMQVSIQRKTKGKWKKYKGFKVVKKSNVAFLNKQFKIKKRGTYRMKVKITFYRAGKKRKKYSIISKIQFY